MKTIKLSRCSTASISNYPDADLLQPLSEADTNRGKMSVGGQPYLNHAQPRSLSKCVMPCSRVLVRLVDLLTDQADTLIHKSASPLSIVEPNLNLPNT